MLTHCLYLVWYAYQHSGTSRQSNSSWRSQIPAGDVEDKFHHSSSGMWEPKFTTRWRKRSSDDGLTQAVCVQDLSSNELKSTGARHVAQILLDNVSLKILKLSGNYHNNWQWMKKMTWWCTRNQAKVRLREGFVIIFFFFALIIHVEFFLSCSSSVNQAKHFVFYSLESIFNVFLTGNEFIDDDAKYFADALSVSGSFFSYSNKL